MPASPALSRRRPAARLPRSAAVAYREALVLVDVSRLQAAAWAQFHTARKRLEKATRDLHRHSEIDLPAYQSWLHRTFPILVTTWRELQDEAVSKTQKIQAVQAAAYLSGRSVKRLWREEKERELHARQNPDESDSGVENEDELPPGEDAADDSFASAPHPTRSATARDIYRRLVQHLHPDRGGAWTPERQRLWHEVQQAWAAGNADWLARLEVDWESANEVLGPTSPLSRLYRGIEELDAARRDTERTLREYRRHPAWRFTLTEKRREILHGRVEARLNAEIAMLRREMRHLDSTIAAWEDDWTRADSRAKMSRRRHHRY